MNSTIPLLGGVLYAAGGVPFIRHPEVPFFEAMRISSTQSVIARPRFLRSCQSHESFLLFIRSRIFRIVESE
jgi:hypothetical protein